MSELLTTGQMIDRLKVGSIAEMEPVQYEKLSVIQRQVEFDVMGHLKYRDGQKFVVHSALLNESKWRILPNYVSFDEAMKALRIGRTIFWHDASGGKCEFEPDDYEDKFQLKGFSLQELLEGKWTIEGESNV